MKSMSDFEELTCPIRSNDTFNILLWNGSKFIDCRLQEYHQVIAHGKIYASNFLQKLIVLNWNKNGPSYNVSFELVQTLVGANIVISVSLLQTDFFCTIEFSLSEAKTTLFSFMLHMRNASPEFQLPLAMFFDIVPWKYEKWLISTNIQQILCQEKKCQENSSKNSFACENLNLWK